MTIRGLIADDDALLRAGLVVILGTAGDLEVVAEAGDGIKAVRLCRHLSRRRLRVRRAAAGASGFLLKRASPERLLDAVCTVAAGDALLDPSVTRSLITRLGRCSDSSGATRGDSPPTSTSHRSRAAGAAAGGPGQVHTEIADLLVIAESTAKTHVKRAGQDRRPRPSSGGRRRLSQWTSGRCHPVLIGPGNGGDASVGASGRNLERSGWRLTSRLGGQPSTSPAS
jgi:DNA-binding NarL/FixJ family response regulator